MKISVIGGLRTGKTSLLVSMLYQLQNSPIQKYLSISDNTRYLYGCDGSLIHKQQDLTTYLVQYNNQKASSFLLDRNPSYEWVEYLIESHYNGTSYNMNFIDVPGSYLDGSVANNTIIECIQESSVIIITIDTPFLMGHKDGYCNKNISSAVNESYSIINFLSHIDNKNIKGKMVVFAPIKCEKWVKEGRLNEVVDKVKDEYQTTIRFLQLRSKSYPTNVCIMPVETIGNVLFSEMTDAKISKKTRKKIYVVCCQMKKSGLKMEK